ncbi:MAG: tetratricopeptide repeat protein [candidate division Zixibacteria bacterium]|nr:tetratricopeptide repeat protein [candidate division Zixibacteria bacterium]
MLRKFLLLVVLLATGCSQSLYMQGRKSLERGEYDRAIEQLYQEISTNPANNLAWRELGVAYYEQGNLTKAEDALKQAAQIQPDAKTQMYMGLLYEKQNMNNEAIRAYGGALSLDPSSKTRNLVRARLDHLVSQRIRSEVDRALADEAAIDVESIPDNTIAVADFDGSLLGPELAPLARGLAEFTAIDLAKVRSLRVVDRLKLDVLMQELKLSSSSMVDASSAPRLGRLLGSQHLVTANVTDLGGEGIRLNGVLVNAKDSSSQLTDPRDAQLQRIFDVQKAFVFEIIDDLGIELTVEERDAISEVPTESYLAMLAYSRGLDYQRQGLYRDAQASFSRAVAEDQAFAEAGKQAEQLTASLSSGIDAASLSSFEAAITSSIDVPALATSVATRLSSSGLNVGIIPDINLRNLVTSPPVNEQPNTVTVVVTGDLNE